MRPATCPNTVLAREISRGATVLAPDGRDITTAVRSTFNQMLPVTGGDKGAAAAQAVRAALGDQREVRR